MDLHAVVYACTDVDCGTLTLVAAGSRGPATALRRGEEQRPVCPVCRAEIERQGTTTLVVRDGG